MWAFEHEAEHASEQTAHTETTVQGTHLMQETLQHTDTNINIIYFI